MKSIIEHGAASLLEARAEGIEDTARALEADLAKLRGNAADGVRRSLAVMLDHAKGICARARALRGEESSS